MELKTAALTDTGRARSNNEDSVLDDAPLVAVADGMGGAAGGEVASGIAIDVLKAWKDKLEGLDGREAADKLREALVAANRAVYAKSQEDEELLGMGTTMTAGWLANDTLALAHVGDSRAYLMRGSRLQQLTEDQTVAQEWVRRGRLSEEEATTSPQRHILLQAIGAESDRLDIATLTVDLLPGDRLMVASDGLSGMVRDGDLQQILSENPDPDDACRALVAAANAAGGEDNISVVLVQVPGEAPADAGDAPVGAEPLQIDRGAATGVKGRSKPRNSFSIPRVGLVAGGAVLVLALMAVLLLARPTGPNYVVSTRDGVVVVLDGSPGDNNSPARGDLVRRFTDEKLTEFPGPYQRQLRAGYPVESLAEARELVTSLPHEKGPRDTPTPEPDESPSPLPRATPKDTPKP